MRGSLRAQIPEFGPDDDLGDDLKGERRGCPKCRFITPRAKVGAGCLRLVEKIQAEEQSILDKLGIGFNPGLEFVIYYLFAGGFVSTTPFRFGRERDRKRREATVEDQISEFTDEAVQARHTTISDVGHVVNIVIGNRGPQLDLHILVRCELIFEHGFGSGIRAGALAETADSDGFERLSPSSPTEEPIVKPKMYLVSISWNALSSCASLRTTVARIAAAAPR